MASTVEQKDFYDVYEWTKEGRLHRVTGFVSLGWLRKYVAERWREGRQVLVRQVLVERPSWYHYSSVSDSGLAYAWDQNLDRFVEGQPVVPEAHWTVESGWVD